MIWVAFILCVAVVVTAGSRLTNYGDIIADRTGWGRAWVGVVLLASVTSLPELATGLGSVAIFNVPDIALGDIFGSCMFNLVIIVLLDALQKQGPISSRVHEGQALSAQFGIFLLAIAGLSLLAGDSVPRIGWVGLSSLVLLAVYLAAIRTVFQYEKSRISQFVEAVAETGAARDQKLSLRSAVIRYAIYSGITVTGALFLPWIGQEIAQQTGLSQTFVGNVFIAISTSLPELTVAMAALRLDAADMAVGNIFGSNLFNMAILAVDDLAYTNGPLLAHGSSNHLVSVVAAIAMTAIASAGVTYRIRRKRLPVAWDSLGIVITYIVATYILYIRT